MKAKDIKEHDVFIVCPGRSVLTAKRGMAHAGGKITLADVSAKTMAGYLESGKVEVDDEAIKAREAAEVAEQERIEQAIEDGKKRAAAAAKLKEDDDAPTEEQIIEAIGKLDPDNKEHWTNSGAPQVVTLEGILGKQISAAERDVAWAKAQEKAE